MRFVFGYRSPIFLKVFCQRLPQATGVLARLIQDSTATPTVGYWADSQIQQSLLHGWQSTGGFYHRAKMPAEHRPPRGL